MSTGTRLSVGAIAAVLLALAVGGAGSAAADDSPPVTTPGAPVGTSAAPAPAPGGGFSVQAVSCASSEFCVSKDTYFNGPTFKFTGANTNWSYVDYVNLYNEDSSWRSRWTVPVVVYDYTLYGGGQTICVAQNWDVYYANGASDRGSSHKWDGRGAC